MSDRPSSANLAKRLSAGSLSARQRVQSTLRPPSVGSQSARTRYTDATEESSASSESPRTYELPADPRRVQLNYLAKREVSPRHLTTSLPRTPQRREDEEYRELMSSEDEDDVVAPTDEITSYDEETIVFIDNRGGIYTSWNDTIDLKETRVKRGPLTLRCTSMHTHMCSGIQGENIKESLEVYTIFCKLADKDADGVQGANLFFEYQVGVPTTRFVIPFGALPIQVRGHAQNMLNSLRETRKPDDFFLPNGFTIERMIEIERIQLGIKKRQGLEDNQKVIIVRPPMSLQQNSEVVRSLQKSIEGRQSANESKELNVVLDTSVVVHPTLISLYETFLAAKRQTPVTVYTQLAWDTFANENRKQTRKDPVVTMKGQPRSKLKEDVDRILTEIHDVNKTQDQSASFESFKNKYGILNNRVQKRTVIDNDMLNELNALRRKCSIRGMFQELYDTDNPPEFLVHTQQFQSNDKGLLSKTYILFPNFNTSESRFLVLTDRLWVSEDMSMQPRIASWI